MKLGPDGLAERLGIMGGLVVGGGLMGLYCLGHTACVVGMLVGALISLRA